MSIPRPPFPLTLDKIRKYGNIQNRNNIIFNFLTNQYEFRKNNAEKL